MPTHQRLDPATHVTSQREMDGKKRGVRRGQEEERSLLSHRLSLRLFLRCGLDWALCGEETSFFRSLVGEGGPVPLPIWMGRKKQKHVLGRPLAHSALSGVSLEAALGTVHSKPQVAFALSLGHPGT